MFSLKCAPKCQSRDRHRPAHSGHPCRDGLDPRTRSERTTWDMCAKGAMRIRRPIGAQPDHREGKWEGSLVNNREHSSPHADQFAWAEEFEDAVYCLAIVINLNPEATLARLGATDISEELSLTAVVERAYQAWDAPHAPDAGLFVASTQFGSDTVVVEPNGYICADEEFLRPLSAGTAVYSVYRNMNSYCHFSWYANGELQLWFDPIWLADREGPAATRVGDVLEEVGFDLDADSEPRYMASSLALAASLSGVRLTFEALAAAAYVGGSVRPTIMPHLDVCG